MRIVVTGGIGSGKSTVTKELLAQLPGYKLFDFDATVHALYEDAAFCARLTAEFGTCVRKELSDLAFAIPDIKADIERMSKDRLQRALHDALESPDLIVEFPLLFESGWMLERFEHIIAVACTPETQLTRVMLRDACPEAKAKAIIKSQFSTELKVTLSDYVVHTDKGVAHMREQVSDIVAKMKATQLFERAGRDFPNAPALWDRLQAAYGEQHRAYHTLEHIRSMFKHFDKHRDLFEHPLAVSWAIWFHDFVYEVDERYSENETRSADAFMDLLRTHAPELLEVWHNGVNQALLAAALIRCTKGHAVREDALFANDAGAYADAELFLDIDLSILSANPSAINGFERDIRLEFIAYPTKQFALGRVAAMTHFVQRPKVYLSARTPFSEEIARANLEKIINHWQAEAEEAV